LSHKLILKLLIIKKILLENFWHIRISVVTYVSTSGKYVLKYTLIAVVDETLM